MNTRELVTCVALLAAAVSPAALADSGLDALKAIAQGAKVFQEKMGQGSQTSPPESADGTAEQGTMGSSNSPGAINEETMKAARKKMDVVGVKIGTSLDEALRALKAHNPNLKVRDKHAQIFSDADNKPYPVLYFLATGERPRAMEQVYLTVSLPPRQRIVHVDRTISYRKSEAPTVEATLAALRSKFGEPIPGIRDDVNNRQLIWQVGVGARGNSTCGGSLLRIQAWNMNLAAGGGRANIRKDCGLVVYARVRAFNDNPALVTELAVGTSDHVMAYQDWDDSHRYLANASKNRDRIEIEVAKKRNAPKL